LNVCCISASLFPDTWQLIKSSGLNMFLELWEKANKDLTFISRIITDDDRWIYGYDPETKQQSL
jgi:hypothetical protein